MTDTIRAETGDFSLDLGHQKSCDVCGSGFAKKRTESRAYWATKRFCSRKCKGISHSAQMRRGAIRSVGAAFRQTARNYLKAACAVCGWDSASCDVAHIVPGLDRLDNVVMLCPNHHRMYDQGLIPRDEILGARDGFFGGGLLDLHGRLV